jgi:hypothetical protein
MANTDFRVKNGLIVGNNIFVANSTTLNYSNNLFVANSTTLRYGNNLFVANSTTLTYSNNIFVANSTTLNYSNNIFVANSTTLNYSNNLFVANSTTLRYGNSFFTVNSTVTTINTGIILNGNTGLAGQVLTSNGTGAVYWSYLDANNAQYNFSNSVTFTGNATFLSDFTFANTSKNISFNTSNNILLTSNLTINLSSNSINMFANYANITSNTTFSNTVTFTANVTFSNTTSSTIAIRGLVANGTLGTNGYILSTNGSIVYWKEDFSTGTFLTDYSSSSNSSTFYIGFSSNTSGTAENQWANAYTSNKLIFVPSTGSLSATIFNTTSDANQKVNIREIQNPLDKLICLKGVEFDWKDNNQPSMGVIAQELEKVLPELVSTMDNGSKVVNYNGLIALLIEAVKELSKK